MELKEQVTIGEHVDLVNTQFGNYCKVGNYCSLENTSMGDYSYCEPNCVMQNVVIKKFSNIARSVRIGATQHPLERPTLHHFTYRSEMYGMGEDDKVFFQQRAAKVVTVGDDTWIGHGAIIQSGVHIGIGAVVGSGAVVTKDVPAYAIVAGVPARIIRFRYDSDTIKKLLAIAWWNWEDEVLRSRFDDFRLDVHEFVDKYEVKHDK